MGIIQRQVFKNNIIAIAAVIVGAISNIFIYPLDFETKGFADAVLRWATFLTPFFLLGGAGLMVKYPLYIADDLATGARKLFSRVGAIVTTVLVGTGLFLALGGTNVLSWVSKHILPLGHLADYPWVILCLLAVFCYTRILMTNLVNYNRIAVPVVFNSLLPKLAIPLLLLSVVYWGMSQEAFTANLILVYVLTVLGLFAYTVHLGKHKVDFSPLNITEERRREMFLLAGFSIFGSIGSVLSTQIDTIFVNTYLGNVPTGIYSFAVFASTVMGIPNQAVNSIAGPIVSAAWKNHDIDKISYLYREAATVLFGVGGLILVGGALCLPQVFALSANPTSTALAYTAFLWLGAGQLVDQLTSINGMIIGYSKYFRWNTYFILVLGVFNLTMNYLLIVHFDLGISGAALATFLSLSIYNLLKVTFIWWELKIHPLSLSIAYSSMALITIFLTVNWIPPVGSHLIDLLIRGGLATILFALYAYFTNGIPQLRAFLHQQKSLLK